MPANQYHIKIVEPDTTAPAIISRASNLSISESKQALQKGAVWLTDSSGTRRLRRAGKKLAINSTLHFYYNPDVLSQSVESPRLHADEIDYSVWIKPRGVFSQGSKWGDHCSITRMIESSDDKQRPVFLIHRLDRAATGLMLVGHRKRVAKSLADMFAKRSIEKIYHAIVYGNFGPQAKPVIYNAEIEGKNAVTFVRCINYDKDRNRSLLEVNIETGRKHQIRRHLSDAGFPIVGDRLYGGDDSDELQLAAVSLAFECPVSTTYRDYQLDQIYRLSLFNNNS
jgi:tRNA pseudouridine32 synthase/23S rRNA pseudouridine746 synthase